MSHSTNFVNPHLKVVHSADCLADQVVATAIAMYVVVDEYNAQVKSAMNEQRKTACYQPDCCTTYLQIRYQLNM
jgi:hypothetical protein